MDMQEMQKELRRQRHETDDQFEARYKVYKQYISKYGEEEAETLSMIFSNIKYMDCRYPPEVEARLADCGALSNAFSAPVAKKGESQFQTIINRAVTNAAITEEKLNAATLATARKTNQA